MKMMQALWRRASLNSLRTREAPTPAYISTKSEPLAEMNGTPASPAIDRASSVLPVPGGPTSRMPRGMRPPMDEKRCRILEEVDDLLDFIFRLVNTCHVGKRHRDELGVDRAGLLEGRNAAGDDAEQRETRKAKQQQPKRDGAITARPARIFDRFHIEVDAALREIRHKAGVRRDVALRRDRHMARAVSEVELEFLL